MNSASELMMKAQLALDRGLVMTDALPLVSGY